MAQFTEDEIALIASLPIIGGPMAETFEKANLAGEKKFCDDFGSDCTPSFFDMIGIIPIAFIAIGLLLGNKTAVLVGVLYGAWKALSASRPAQVTVDETAIVYRVSS